MSGNTVNTGFHKAEQYWCWRTEYHEIGDGQLIEAISGRDAAEKYVEANFDRWEYPLNNVINVDRCRAGVVYTFDVECIPKPSFYATERKPKR